MSKINNSSQSDDSNSQLPRSVTTKPPIKDLPKLEVVKVIAPKTPESTPSKEQQSLPQNEELVKSVPSVPKIIPAAARVRLPSLNRGGDIQTAADNRTENSQETKVCLQPIPEPTEPFQYRAIGVINGKYIANEDNFAKGLSRSWIRTRSRSRIA